MHRIYYHNSFLKLTFQTSHYLVTKFLSQITPSYTLSNPLIDEFFALF
jgi:hypothetical protein